MQYVRRGVQRIPLSEELVCLRAEFIHFDSERLDVRSKDGPMARCSLLAARRSPLAARRSAARMVHAYWAWRSGRRCNPDREDVLTHAPRTWRATSRHHGSG